MSSPFRNYDAWLTTDRSYDEQEAAYEALLEFAEENGLDPEAPATKEAFDAAQVEINRLIDESYASYLEEMDDICREEGF